MNVPKLSDIELIYACLEHEISGHQDKDVVKAGERLRELTQPQPIETAPRDGTEIILFGGTLPAINGESSLPNDSTCGTKAGFLNAKICEPSGWVGDNWQRVLNPTHWLPCVTVDLANLGLTGQRSK